MTNPRIQQIEQEILELAKKDKETYANSTSTSHFDNPNLAIWAQWVIELWSNQKVTTGNQIFIPNEKLALVQQIIKKGRYNYEFTTVETQEKLSKLFQEWKAAENWKSCEQCHTDYVKKFVVCGKCQPKIALEKAANQVINFSSLVPELEAKNRYLTDYWEQTHKLIDNISELVQKTHTLIQQSNTFLSRLQTTLDNLDPDFDLYS